MNTPFLPLADVEATVENQRFWDALRDGRIDLPLCATCRAFVWYPRAICPGCHSADDIGWRPLPGTGRVYSYTVVAKGTGRWKDAGPYVVAYVQLDSGLDGIAGPRVLTNVVGDEAQSRIAVDDVVSAVVDRETKRNTLGDDVERSLLRFELG